MNRTALVLVILGALNWFLVGVAQFDLVAAIFGGQAGAISRIVYILIGAAGIVAFFFWNLVARRESYEEETAREAYQNRAQTFNYEFGREYIITDRGVRTRGSEDQNADKK